jgi:hypothetical protein
MKKTIGFKNKKYLVETIITSLLILFLVCLCAYKLIQGCSRIINCIIYAGLVLVGLYWLVVEIINAIKYLKTPNELIAIDDFNIYIYYHKETVKIPFLNIIEIETKEVVKQLLSSEGKIVFKTKDKEYQVNYIKNLEEVKNKLQRIIGE